MIMAWLVGPVGVLVLIWLLGYILVWSLAPGTFMPRTYEAAVSLLVGLSVTGVVLIGPLYLIHDAVWYGRFIRWLVPALVLIGSSLMMSRRWRALTFRTRAAIQGMSAWLLIRRIAAWSSAISLAIGVVIVITNSPSAQRTVELFAVQSGQTARVSVVSSVPHPGFVIIVISGSRSQTVTVPPGVTKGGVSTATITVSVHDNARINLYSAINYSRKMTPLRWLRLTG